MANSTNTKPALTFDQRRRQLRRDVLIERQADSDKSDARLFWYARKMDVQLEAEGYNLAYPTEWANRKYDNVIASDA